MPLAQLQDTHLNAPYWYPWRTWFNPVPQFDERLSGQVAYYLNQQKPATLTKRFVAQEQLPAGMAYESYIATEHAIPTRDGLHDFFNGLCWFAFPHTKTRFNQLHQEQIRQLGTQARGRVRDMLTVIDENGFLIQAPDPLWDALQAQQWQKAFLELRPLWQETRLMVFGHALLEKLVHPYKAITAHAVRIPNHIPCYIPTSTPTPPLFQRPHLPMLDIYLHEFLSAECLLTKPYIPIPIFGIPGWSEEQAFDGFYADEQVFRPARVKTT